MAKVAEAAKHISLSERRFRELLDREVIKRQARGEYDLDEVRDGYIAHLRELAAGRGADNDPNLSRERALLAREQREGLALKRAAAEGKLADIDIVARAAVIQAGKIKNKLLGLPSRVAARVVALKSAEEVHNLLYGEAVQICEELSAGAADVSVDEVHAIDT